jgi:hypothetical protein
MTEEVQQPAGLSLQDLQTVLSIINITTERGAFKPNELTAVGTLYDKFSAFVEAARVESEGVDGPPEEEEDRVDATELV